MRRAAAPGRLPPQAGHAAVEPLLELPDGALHVQAVEEGAAVEAIARFQVAGPKRVVERRGVAPERVLGYAHLLVAPARHGLRAQAAAKEVQRAPSAARAWLWSSSGQNSASRAVAPVKAPG